jgi:Fe-S-cluster containining protein
MEKNMIRNCSLEDISDGKLYDINDLVKADCGGCTGCSACCRGMGKSIVLDPYDIFKLTKELNISFEELLSNSIELNVVDGIVLPNLKMTGEEEKCFFLDEKGRCSIHSARPGICRLFPLGRYYENGDFKYFLQVNECAKKERTKIKVKKWIDIPDWNANKEYILAWHHYLKEKQEDIAQCNDDAVIRNISMEVLKRFYLTPYDTKKDFYQQFYERLEK